MIQMTLTDMEYSNRKKKTKREEFLNAMDEIIPWSYWVEMIRHTISILNVAASLETCTLGISVTIYGSMEIYVGIL